MKKRNPVRLFVVLALIAVLLGSASRAPAQKASLVTIPFAFEANHRMLPAGDYKVLVMTPHLLSLIDRHTSTYKGYFLVRPELENEIETHGRLIFLHHDRRYYLTQVRFGGQSVHANLMIPSSLQREMAKNTPPTVSTIEIAMK